MAPHIMVLGSMLVVALGAATGCAGIDTRVRNDDQLVRTERQQRLISPEPVVVVAKQSLLGTSIGLQLAQHFQCQDVSYPVFHRTRYLERQGRPVMGMHPLLWEFLGLWRRRSSDPPRGGLEIHCVADRWVTATAA